MMDIITNARGHLGAAIVQSVDTDDQIIMDHVKAAYKLLGTIPYDVRETVSQSPYFLGRKFAEEENAALAGMAEMPEAPAEFEGDEGFMKGYLDWREEQERTHGD